MTTRMEKVAEDVALAAIRNASTAAAPLLQPEKLQESFRAAWPTGESRTPINDAMNAGVNATTAGVHPQDRETWKARMEDAWSRAVTETVTGYFQTARQSFEQGHPLGRSGNSHRRCESDAGTHRRRPRVAPQHPR